MSTPDNHQSDDVDHLRCFVEQAASWPESDLLQRVAVLLSYPTFLRSTIPYATAFVNDVAGTLALARAYRQIRAAYVLACHGFDAETRAILRAAYESAGLARVAAKDVQIANDWFLNGKTFPEAAVRRWLSTIRKDPKAMVAGFRDYYETYSAWAHPTATSCLPLMQAGESAFVLDFKIKFSEEASRLLVREIAAVGIFTCFAWRNAVVDETVLHPAWRQDLYSLAEALAGEPLDHLQRDWDLEQQRHKEMLENLRAPDELDETLRRHPSSWENVKPTAPS